jgi:hypothetical protein
MSIYGLVLPIVTKFVKICQVWYCMPVWQTWKNGLILPTIVHYGQLWSRIINYGQEYQVWPIFPQYWLSVLTNFGKVYQVWPYITYFATYGLIYPIKVQYIHLWPSMTNYGPVCPNIISSDQRWQSMSDLAM